jgi:hypothetical protein
MDVDLAVNVHVTLTCSTAYLFQCCSSVTACLGEKEIRYERDIGKAE